MRCPFCDADKDSLKVIDSRGCDGGKSIRRRRECLNCKKRFTTYERVETTIKLTVVKKDGRRVPWDRNKILTGLERACFKRPVPESDLVRIAEEVEEETYRGHDREAPTSFVGKLVAEKLRRVDQVAYVRFASVYRQFKTLEELVAEARAVLDARRYDDPDQGKLFLEPSASVAGATAPGDDGEAARNGDHDAMVQTEPAASKTGTTRSQRRRARPPASTLEPESSAVAGPLSGAP